MNRRMIELIYLLIKWLIRSLSSEGEGCYLHGSVAHGEDLEQLGHDDGADVIVT